MEKLSLKEINCIGQDKLMGFVQKLSSLREHTGGSPMLPLAVIKIDAYQLIEAAQRISLPQRFLTNIVEARDILMRTGTRWTRKEHDNTRKEIEERVKADGLYCEVLNVIFDSQRSIGAQTYVQMVKEAVQT